MSPFRVLGFILGCFYSDPQRFDYMLAILRDEAATKKIVDHLAYIDRNYERDAAPFQEALLKLEVERGEAERAFKQHVRDVFYTPGRRHDAPKTL